MWKCHIFSMMVALSRCCKVAANAYHKAAAKSLYLPVFFLLFLSPSALLQEYSSGGGENTPTKGPEKGASFALKGPRMLENKRRRSGWRGLRPSCWRQVPVTLQIRPIDRGRDHTPLIRLGDRGPSRLALIRERALIVPSTRCCKCPPSTPPVCARDGSLSVHRWAPGRA